uniref:Uncharacterized protein n=1 Tax=Octopus bimaculoides TaxID=37653 RepID=A0A0L8HAJ1_OCTBM
MGTTRYTQNICTIFQVVRKAASQMFSIIKGNWRHPYQPGRTMLWKTIRKLIEDNNEAVDDDNGEEKKRGFDVERKCDIINEYKILQMMIMNAIIIIENCS